MKKFYLIILFTLISFVSVLSQTFDNIITRRIFETYSLIEYNIDTKEYKLVIFENSDEDGVLHINMGKYGDALFLINRMINDVNKSEEGIRCYYDINNVTYQPYVLYNQYREKSLYFIMGKNKYDLSYNGLKNINKQIEKINKKYEKN